MKGGQYVAIHGCGGVGLSAIMIDNALGAQVIAVDINDDTLSVARAMGAIGTINATQPNNVVAQVKSITNRMGELMYPLMH